MRGTLKGRHSLVRLLCLYDDEDASHLFLGCIVTARIWKMVCLWLGIPEVQHTILIGVHAMCFIMYYFHFIVYFSILCALACFPYF